MTTAALEMAVDRFEAAVADHALAARKAQEAAKEAADARTRLDEAKEVLRNVQAVLTARTAAPRALVVDEATGQAHKLADPPP